MNDREEDDLEDLVTDRINAALDKMISAHQATHKNLTDWLNANPEDWLPGMFVYNPDSQQGFRYLDNGWWAEEFPEGTQTEPRVYRYCNDNALPALMTAMSYGPRSDDCATLGAMLFDLSKLLSFSLLDTKRWRVQQDNGSYDSSAATASEAVELAWLKQLQASAIQRATHSS